MSKQPGFYLTFSSLDKCTHYHSTQGKDYVHYVIVKILSILFEDKPGYNVIMKIPKKQEILIIKVKEDKKQYLEPLIYDYFCYYKNIWEHNHDEHCETSYVPIQKSLEQKINSYDDIFETTTIIEKNNNLILNIKNSDDSQIFCRFNFEIDDMVRRFNEEDEKEKEDENYDENKEF